MNVIGPTFADPRTSDNWTMSRRLVDGFTNKEPVIRFIDYDMVLIDDLNMLIRETDKLFDFFLLKFIRLDKDNGPDWSKREFFKKNFDFFGELIKIKKHYTLSERVCFGKIQLRSFNGREQIRILTELYEPKFDKVAN